MVIIIISVFIKPSIPASTKDVFLYKMSRISFFAILVAGMLIELDVLHIRSKIPLLKNKSVFSHLLFCIICLITSFTSYIIIYNSTSYEFRLSLTRLSYVHVDTKMPNGKEIDAHLNESEDKYNNTDYKKLFSSEIRENSNKNKTNKKIILDNRVNSSSLNINSNEEETNLIEEKKYYYDTFFNINGIQVKVNSINIKRITKPSGYSVSLEYSLNNQNNHNILFEFSSTSGNEFIYNGKKAQLAAQSSWSNKHSTKYQLEAYENTEIFIADFFAPSSIYEKTINGETFDAIDISNIYHGEQLTITLQISGIHNNQSESKLISFDIDL